MRAALRHEDEGCLGKHDVIILDLKVDLTVQVLVVFRVAADEHVQFVGAVSHESFGREILHQPLHAAEEAAGNDALVNTDDRPDRVRRNRVKPHDRAGARADEISLILVHGTSPFPFRGHACRRRVSRKARAVSLLQIAAATLYAWLVAFMMFFAARQSPIG